MTVGKIFQSRDHTQSRDREGADGVGNYGLRIADCGLRTGDRQYGEGTTGAFLPNRDYTQSRDREGADGIRGSVRAGVRASVTHGIGLCQAAGAY